MLGTAAFSTVSALSNAADLLLWGWNTGSAAMLALGLSIMMVVGHAPVHSTLASFYAEFSPTHVRYNGISIEYQSAGIILGGFMPLIAGSLIIRTGGNGWLVALCIAAQAVIAAAALFLSPETYKRDLTT